MTIKVGVSGAAGQMGRQVVPVVSTALGMELAAALESSGHPLLGKDASVLCMGLSAHGIKISSDFSPADVYIDFSVPSAALKLARKCRETKTPLVIGATGFSPAETKELESVAADIPMVIAPNMSLSVNVLFMLAKAAARHLPDCDMEILEAHHRNKKDAPSGTALHLGEIMAKAAGKVFDPVHVRKGSSNERKDGEIGIWPIRGGDVVGAHRAIFIGNGEKLEISHSSTDRRHYAVGAIAAARFVRTAAPGLYGMEDVLGGALNNEHS